MSRPTLKVKYQSGIREFQGAIGDLDQFLIKTNDVSYYATSLIILCNIQD